MFDRNGALFVGFVEVQLNTPYVRCPVERVYVSLLSTLVGSLKAISGLSDQVDVYTVFDRL